MLRRLLLAACAAALPTLSAAPAAAQGTLRIGMTAADIPLTHGQPDQGFEGNRFTGIPLYDGLTQWDLSSAERPSVVLPALATAAATAALGTPSLPSTCSCRCRASITVSSISKR